MTTTSGLRLRRFMPMRRSPRASPLPTAHRGLTVDFPAMVELSKRNAAPICGKDFKTGQTFMKTFLAPALKARMLGVRGWFSDNILGNRDGEVLDDPQSFMSKEVSKLGSLEYIFQPELYPDLYKDLYHKIRINYYPPRGDDKEAWDNIDIFGWLGYPMQIKVNFLCRDSILAAPDRAGSGALSGPGQAHPVAAFHRHSGVAQLLSEVAPVRPRPLSGARSLHPVDEAEKHPAPHHGRRPDHPPRPGILRLSTCGAANVCVLAD